MMIHHMSNKWLNTLKGRLGFLLIVSTILPILLIGYLSYYYIYVVQVHKVNEDLKQKADADRVEIERRIDDLSNATQLLVVDGGIGRDVVDYQTESNAYRKSELFRDINKSLSNIYLSNPNLCAVFYYFPGKNIEYQFSNTIVDSSFSPQSLPHLYKANLLSFYGPHRSAEQRSHDLVFSLIRQLEDDSGVPFYVYVETKLSAMSALFPSEMLGMSISYQISNAWGKEVYANKPQMGAYEHAFESRSGKGWTFTVVTNKSDYTDQIQKWRYLFIVISLGTLVTSFLFAMLIWRMVSTPLSRINRIIRRFRLNVTDRSDAVIELEEFKQLYENFVEMRNQIADLIVEVESKEKRRGELEVEKLLVQINPHFIHNTLNTIQWIARMNKQTEIAKLVSIFTRVLHYNLGKKNIIVSLGEELTAIRDYIELQSMRYDHSFNVDYDIDTSLEEVPMPRFILQPIVENALYHGLEHDDGRIIVSVRDAGHSIVELEVADNGKGMSKEEIEQLMTNYDRGGSSGLGIGLRYVVKMLETYYNKKATFEIKSEEKVGTRIVIRIPNKLPLSSRDSLF